MGGAKQGSLWWFTAGSGGGAHPYLAHAWARRGADLHVAAPGQARKVAMPGALDAAAGTLVVATSRTRKSSDRGRGWVLCAGGINSRSTARYGSPGT